MLNDEPKAMAEIHEIRIKLQEKEKNLSIEEKINRTNRIAEEFVKRLNLGNRLVRRAKSTHFVPA